MKVLLVGVGGVGEAIAVIAKDRPWMEQMVLADYNLRTRQGSAREARRPASSPSSGWTPATRSRSSSWPKSTTWT